MRLKLIVSLLNLILFWPCHATASDIIDNPADLQLYNAGISYRNAKNYKAAIDSFIPLAEQGHVKAQHNLAMAFWHIGDEQQAYQCLKRAADVGFKSSINNIKNMNLMYALLPDEMISEITSHLTMSELCIFNQLSKRSYNITEKLMLSTNYLTSTRPYAQYIKSLFTYIGFHPQPESIHLIRSINATEGDVEVHYRDHQHLEKIAERVKSCASDVYYVHDRQAVDGHEFIAVTGSLIKSFMINVDAKSSIMVLNDIQNLPLRLMLPTDSATTFKYIGNLDLLINTMDKSFTVKTLQAVYFIKKSDENLSKNRIVEATKILNEQMKSRQDQPDLYPGLKQLCPSLTLFNVADKDGQQIDYISSQEPLFYVAQTRHQMTELRESFPDFNQAISLIKSNCSHFGIYCQKPLQLTKGFKISTTDHLISIGKMNIEDYNLMIDTNESWWRFNNPIFAHNTLVRAKSVASNDIKAVIEDESFPKIVRTLVLIHMLSM